MMVTRPGTSAPQSWFAGTRYTRPAGLDRGHRTAKVKRFRRSDVVMLRPKWPTDGAGPCCWGQGGRSRRPLVLVDRRRAVRPALVRSRDSPDPYVCECMPEHAPAADHARPRTLVEKIWDRHVVTQDPGAPAILAIDLH